MCYSSRAQLRVSIVESAEDKQLALAVRLRVFVDEQGHTRGLQVDEHDEDPGTVHFIGRDPVTNECVAVARCMVDSRLRQARIGRVALLPECRGKGFGVQLMEAVEAHVRPHVDSFILLAQVSKQGFYERCGYQRKDDQVQLDEHIPVCWMTKGNN